MSQIVHPVSGIKFSLSSAEGLKILRKYVNFTNKGQTPASLAWQTVINPATGRKCKLRGKCANDILRKLVAQANGGKVTRARKAPRATRAGGARRLPQEPRGNAAVPLPTKMTRSRRPASNEDFRRDDKYYESLSEAKKQAYSKKLFDSAISGVVLANRQSLKAALG